MAKVTATGWGSEGTNAADPDYLERQAEKWPGKHSSKSKGRPAKKPAAKKRSRPSPAPTTEQSSRKDPAVSSTASGTVGSTPSDVLPAHPKGPVE